jgi:excisionase family DNA binding protein
VAVAHPPPESLLSVRDVADRLRVSRATVYALCDRGALPHLRVSNAIRLRGEDLEAFIRRGRR